MMHCPTLYCMYIYYISLVFHIVILCNQQQPCNNIKFKKTMNILNIYIIMVIIL